VALTGKQYLAVAGILAENASDNPKLIDDLADYFLSIDDENFDRTRFVQVANG
jgi:hypothetical protein